MEPVTLILDAFIIFVSSYNEIKAAFGKSKNAKEKLNSLYFSISHNLLSILYISKPPSLFLILRTIKFYILVKNRYMMEDSKARRALPKYFSILEGKVSPNFLLLKKVKLKFHEDMNLNELWKIHHRGMNLLRRGEFVDEGPQDLLQLKAYIAQRMTESCNLCELKCRADRRKSMGACRVKNSKIATYFLHFGEERELVPSFTIFFSGCNFRCVFCQNWDISQSSVGSRIPEKEMARIIENAFLNGARNVNFVGGEPTPNIPYILKTMWYVNSPIPIVWNSNMYMSEEAMKLLDGFVDIYLGDLKWSNNEIALMYSKIPNYWETITRNFKLALEHYRVEFLIRHLVIPNHLENTHRILEWIKNNLGKDLRLNIMFQYFPHYRARNYGEINKRVSYEEMKNVEKMVKEMGFSNAIVG